MSPPVLFVAFQTDSKANGGLESLTHILARIERRRVVLAQREDDFTARWRAMGCEVVVDPVPVIKALSGVRLLAYRAQRVPAIASINAHVHRVVRESGARVVHMNDMSAFWYAGLGARSAGAKLVLNIRDTRPDGRYSLRWRFARTVVHRMVLLSEEMKREIDTALVPLVRDVGARASFIYSGVNLAEMRPPSDAERRTARLKLGISDEDIAVGYVGVCNDKKNQLGFIQSALPRLLGSIPTLKIFFIGDFDPVNNDYARRCADAVAALGCRSGAVRFVGFSETPSVWYRSLDLVCLASRFEGMARAMIESLACGTPVVSFDVCSAREIIDPPDGPCGFVIRQGDYGSLCDAIAQLAGDGSRRRAMGAEGARRAQQLFDPTRAARSYEILYQSLEAGG